MNRHVAKAIDAAVRVEHHRSEMARYSRVRATNIRRAVEDDELSRDEVAEQLGVSVSTVNKAVALARDPDGGRARWQGARENGAQETATQAGRQGD